jgi:hypothetical protein
MTQDEIKHDLLQVCKVKGWDGDFNILGFHVLCDKLKQLGVEEEREACAKVCEKHADVYAGLEQNPTAQSAWAACIDNRDAIRARGNT